jgi:hypothetical protein
MPSARRGIRCVWQPATTFHYSISTDVLGLYLERVARKRLDALLDEIDPEGRSRLVNTMLACSRHA